MYSVGWARGMYRGSNVSGTASRMPGGQAGPARVVQRPAAAAGRPAGRSAPRTGSGPSHGTLHCRLLGDARRALGLSEVELAARLGASPAAIFALEAGDGRDMPSWPETVRIVQALLGALGMDPRPVLHALQEERAAVAAATQPRSTVTGQSSAVSRSPSTGSASAPSKSGLRGMTRSLRGAARRRQRWTIRQVRCPRRTDRGKACEGNEREFEHGTPRYRLRSWAGRPFARGNANNSADQQSRRVRDHNKQGTASRSISNPPQTKNWTIHSSANHAPRIGTFVFAASHIRIGCPRSQSASSFATPPKK